MPSLNKNNSAVKRIMQEARELANDPCTDYSASPLEDDIFEWHCTLRGPPGTEFEGGLYHFRILLPAEYPFRPPSLMMLTPNGRFELNTKICISFTNYHEEMWQPAWGVRTAIIGLQGFFPLKGQAAAGVGSIEYPATERKRLATLSREWVCPHCQEKNLDLLPDPPINGSQEPSMVASSSQSPPTSLAPPSPVASPQLYLGAPPPYEPTPEPDVTVHTVHPSLPPTRRSSNATLDGLSSHAAEPSHTVHIDSRHQYHVATAEQNSKHRPPILLDTAICAMMVLAFALLCRKIF